MNEKDIAAMMNNLKSDTKDFRSVFDSSVKKTSIHNTSKENDSKALVKLFDNQVQLMQKNFKDRQKADSELSVAINTANQIDLMFHQVSFDDRTNSAWAKTKTQLANWPRATASSLRSLRNLDRSDLMEARSSRLYVLPMARPKIFITSEKLDERFRQPD